MDYSELKIFAWVEASIVEKLIRNSPREEYTSGQIVLAQWDASNGKWYIIEEGEVVIKINGEERANLKAGEMFWEIALLNEDARVATVLAKTDIKVIIISFDNLIEMLNNDTNSINKEIIRRLEENVKDLPVVHRIPTLDDSPDQLKAWFMK